MTILTVAAFPSRLSRYNFAFAGLMACHACGCAVVGEIKKERYVHYHCTGYADKCPGNLAECRASMSARKRPPTPSEAPAPNVVVHIPEPTPDVERSPLPSTIPQIAPEEIPQKPEG